MHSHYPEDFLINEMTDIYQLCLESFKLDENLILQKTFCKSCEFLREKYYWKKGCGNCEKMLIQCGEIWLKR